jgi:hypothetical protein
MTRERLMGGQGGCMADCTGDWQRVRPSEGSSMTARMTGIGASGQSRLSD